MQMSPFKRTWSNLFTITDASAKVDHMRPIRKLAAIRQLLHETRKKLERQTDRNETAEWFMRSKRKGSVQILVMRTCKTHEVTSVANCMPQTCQTRDRSQVKTNLGHIIHTVWVVSWHNVDVAAVNTFSCGPPVTGNILLLVRFTFARLLRRRVAGLPPVKLRPQVRASHPAVHPDVEVPEMRKINKNKHLMTQMAMGEKHRDKISWTETERETFPTILNRQRFFPPPRHTGFLSAGLRSYRELIQS